MSEEKGDGYLDIGQSEPSEEVGLTQLFHTRYILRAHSLLCRSLQKVRATPHIRNALCGNREEKKKKSAIPYGVSFRTAIVKNLSQSDRCAQLCHLDTSTRIRVFCVDEGS